MKKRRITKILPLTTAQYRYVRSQLMASRTMYRTLCADLLDRKGKQMEQLDQNTLSAMARKYRNRYIPAMDDLELKSLVKKLKDYQKDCYRKNLKVIPSVYVCENGIRDFIWRHIDFYEMMQIICTDKKEFLQQYTILYTKLAYQNGSFYLTIIFQSKNDAFAIDKSVV